MTTSPVTTLTDDLIAELETASVNATSGQWGWDGPVWCYNDEEDAPWLVEAKSGKPIVSGQLDCTEANALYLSHCSPDNMLSLIYELRRLRAENSELAQSLAESRANDQAAMGWLTSLRFASGDRGERMMPELVAHIEELKRDAERYRWLRQACDDDPSNLGVEYGCSPGVDAAIDAAMQNQ